MEEKKITAEPPITVADITIIPINKVTLYHRLIKDSTTFFYLKQPVNVVIVSQSEKRAFQMNGEEVSLEGLIKEVPNLTEMLK